MIRANNTTKKEVNCPKVIKKRVTSQDFERLEVARLSCYIEPRSKPSDIFEKLQEKRRIRHESVIKQLAISLNDVNMRIEKNIRISSMELKAHVKEFDNKLNVILQGIDKLEIAMFCGSVFIDLQNKVNEYKNQQQQLVNEFYEDLTTFENNRAKENANLLHLATEEISKIGYFLPYDIQSFVEHETLKMNQLSLNNRRCYEDLKLTLTLVTEQTFKSFMDKVFCIRENWVQRKLHENLYNTITESEEQASKSIQKLLTRLELRGEELEIHDNPYTTFSTCRTDDWILNVEKVISIIDTLRKNLIEVFKKTIKAIYNGFSPEIEEIKVGMGLIEDLVIEERSIKPLVIEAQNSPVKDTEEMETHWQSTLEDIRNQLKYMAEFIREVGKLWDGHMERICESKKLILKALEKVEKNSQAVLQDLEIKVNIGLDALRQEHVQSKLDKFYQMVLSTLNEIKTNYESTYLEEVSIIEDFYKMIILEADVLSADIKEFIIETSGMKFIHGFSGQFRYIRDVDFGGDMIFREMKLCSQQIQNMKFWKQGIWVAFETIAGRTRESLRPRAEKWIKNKVEALAEKKTVQLELLDKRIQRIETEIYGKRMAEVKMHQNKFEKHKEKIWASLRKAKSELKNLITNRLEKLANAKKALSEIEKSAGTENLPGVIRGNQVMTERKKKEIEKDIETEFEKFRAYCETKLSDNHELNINFMKSIKLFHEGGDYSSEEAKSFITLLEGIDKEIIAEIKSIVKDSEREEGELIKEVSECFIPAIILFSYLYEETLLNQEIQQRLQNFVALVQESAKILKVDFDFLNEHFSCTRKHAENPVSTLDMLEDRLWTFLLQLLYKNISNLLYAVKLPESLVQTDREEKESTECASSTGSCCCAGKYAVNLNNSKINLLRKPRKVEPLSCKEYEDKLFECEIPLEDGGNFMGSMSKDITAEFTYIERLACNFYKSIQGRKILRGDLIPETYENFTERMLTKFYYYNTQIQKFWLKILTDFLLLLGEIKELCNGLLLKKINTYKNSALTSLKNFEADFRDCIQSQICENSKEFDELDKKLLPLHGYPHNVHLLNELEELVVARTANQEVKREVAFKNFKGQVKCFRVQHVQDKFEINNIELLYLKLRDTLFTEDLGSNLMQEILNICNNGGFCRKKSSKNNFGFDKKPGNVDTENSEKEVVPEEHQLHITDKNIPTTQDFIQQLRQIVERDRYSGVQGPKRPSTAESFERNLGENAMFAQEKFNVFMDIIDFEEHAAGALQMIDKYIRYLKSFAESQESLQEEELFKWLNRWKSNVKKIQKLYRIKCETNPSASVVVGTGNRNISSGDCKQIIIQ